MTQIVIGIHSRKLQTMKAFPQQAIVAFVIWFSPFVVAFPVTDTNVLTSNELILINWCPVTIWPGILNAAESETLENGGFELLPTLSKTVKVTGHWKGEIWGRTGCLWSKDVGSLVCDTGDCGVGISCANATANVPVTLALIEFGTPHGNETRDNYVISLAKGYNVQVQIRPVLDRVDKRTLKRFDCNLSGCFKDLNTVCPERFAARHKRRGIIEGCYNPISQDEFKYGSNLHPPKNFTRLQEMDNTLEFSSMIDEYCPDSLVLNSAMQMQKCRKGIDGFSAFEIIFCP